LILALRRVEWQNTQSVHDFILHLFLIHNYSASHFFGLNPSFWSIAVEAQLYLLYPLLWYGAYRIGWLRTLLITLGIELILRGTETFLSATYGQVLPQYLTGSPFYFWFSWAAGAYAAEMHRRGQKLMHESLVGWICILVGFAADTWNISSEILFTLVATGSALLLLSDWNIPVQFRNWPVLLGTWSYSLYLIHQRCHRRLQRSWEKEMEGRIAYHSWLSGRLELSRWPSLR
jgi:peptidoglycan/LPS O-acetylase OafA/YrhL